MKKNVLVVGPALSRSGYGEQTRLALRALRSREDLFNVFIIPTIWGGTGWLVETDEEREWIDQRIVETQNRNSHGIGYDASIQVDIPWAPPPPDNPNAVTGWRPMTDHDIGFTAGIETNKISPQWVESTQKVKKIIVVSEHSKNVFNETVYTATDRRTGRQMQIGNKTPVDVVGFPFRDIEAETVELELKHDFNFLVMAQWCRRKNLENTVKWFLEEFHDDEVGLVIKTNLIKNCLMDRTRSAMQLQNIADQYPDRKCTLNLLHGNLTDAEVQGLYKHPKIKAFLSLAHGEGFGIPIFDAVCNEMPVVTSSWSGPVDFLTMPDKKGRPSVVSARVDFTLSQIQDDAVWEGILMKDSLWCYADEKSAKKKMREVVQRYPKFKSRSKALAKHIKEKFCEAAIYEKFINALEIETEEFNVDSWLDDMNIQEID